MNDQPTSNDQPTTNNDKPKTKVNFFERLKEHPVSTALGSVVALVITIEAFTGAITNIPYNLNQILPDRSFIITGDLIPRAGVTVPERLAVAIHWRLNRSTVYQSSRISTVNPGTGHISYNISLTDNPPDEYLMESEGAKVGVGSIAAFGDRNGNGIHDDDEEVLGASEEIVLTYLRGNLSSVTAAKLPLSQGYSLTKVDASEDDTVLQVVPRKEKVNIVLTPDKKQNVTSNAAALLFNIFEELRRRKLGLLVIDTERSVSVTVNDTLRSKREIYLAPGPNVVVLQHPQYGRHSETVEISQGKKKKFKCRFEHLVSVTTEPYLGSAVVFLDDKTTDMQGAGKFTVGPKRRHTVDVRLAGYRISRHRIDGLQWRIGAPDPFMFDECLPTNTRRITFTLIPSQ